MFAKYLLLCLLYCDFLRIECKTVFRNDYTYFNETNSFYKLHKDVTPFSWLHAKGSCELEGATLFYAENEREAKAIADLFSGSWTAEKIYVGIYKHTAIRNQIDAQEGFKTMDGQPLESVYHMWERGEPNNGGGIEHCTGLLKTRLLRDYPCFQPLDDLHFICKKTEVTMSKKACKPGQFCINEYIYMNETRSFYKFHDDVTPYSWVHAKTACELEGATLFYPENARELELVITYFWGSWTAEKIYVGIYKPTAIRNQIDATESFKTMDGRALEAVHHTWQPGEPNNGAGIEHCVCMMKNGLLRDYPCLQPFDDVHFICRRTEAQNRIAGKFFRKGYKYLEETESFYKIHTINRNWQDAKTTCELEGATLFYPQNEEEADRVISYWNSTQSSFWIHVGISALNVKDVYETVDGLPIEDVYHEWAPAEPSGDSEACVLLRRDGVITDDECDLSWPFICKKTEASLRWNDLCDVPDSEYTYYEKTGRCYKLHLTPKSWKDSYITCSMEQSRLAVINSDEEAKIFVDMITRSPKDLMGGDYLRNTVHLGFKYDNGWRSYQGTHIMSSGYAKWANGVPDGTGNETCGSMTYDGLLNAVNCDVRGFFICVHTSLAK